MKIVLKTLTGIKYSCLVFTLLNFQYAQSQNTDLDTLTIDITIYQEDLKNNGYVLDWNDSMGIYDNNILVDRPYELYCYISDKRGLIASYTGLSTSFTFCYFETTDSLVDIIFVLKPNFNSKKAHLKTEPDTAWLTTSIEYHKIELPVKRIDNLPLALNKNNAAAEIVTFKNTCTRAKTIEYIGYDQKKNQTNC